MKRWVCILLCIMMVLAMTGCGSDNSSAKNNQANGVEQVLQEGMAAADGRQVGVNEGAPKPEVKKGDDTVLSRTKGIDVDLTTLSSTMVYSEVYNMLSCPDDYKGKTIKMEGQFVSYRDEFQGIDYYACVIMDATACCSQGLEFVPTGKYSYPEDFPSDGDMVTVIGKFDTYMEGDYEMCTLRNAEFSIQ